MLLQLQQMEETEETEETAARLQAPQSHGPQAEQADRCLFVLGPAACFHKSVMSILSCPFLSILSCLLCSCGSAIRERVGTCEYSL